MGTFIYQIIIAPLELLVELLFVFFMKSFDQRGLAIAGVSLVMSLIMLPLSIVAESIQKKEREARKALESGINKIKAVFRGDERYMILSTYYRQNHYHPVYALRGSLSLFIQIPFFIAAFRFFSGLEQLQGSSLWWIADLGKPDALVHVGAVRLNLLPFVMTSINLVSAVVYTRGYPLRDKIQTYGIPFIFLLLLYDSPSGLVLYWTLNNCFSLAKNLFQRFRSPLRLLYVVAVSGMILGTVIIILINPTINLMKAMAVIILTLTVCLVPVWLRIGKRLYDTSICRLAQNKKDMWWLLVLSSLVLVLLNGLLIPSNLISSSVTEFAFTGDVSNPMAYLGMVSSFYIGLWLVWPISIYSLFNQKIRAFMTFTMLSLSVVSLLNAIVFPGKYGVINALLQFENVNLLKNQSFGIAIVPILSSIIVLGLLWVLIRNGKFQLLKSMLLVMVVAIGLMVGYNGWSIQSDFKDLQAMSESNQIGGSNGSDLEPYYHLSKNGKNVIILMLDRAISSYFPYIMDQFPELKEQFLGFTYYPNTVSFGRSTMLGSPALMGGYEYTPDRINERDDEKLVDKHNESMLVLPRLFSEAGYQVTVTDPPFSNYTWSGDLSPFSPYPEIRVENISSLYALPYKRDHKEDLDERNSISTVIRTYLPLLSLMKTVFPVMRELVYDDGNYFLAKNISNNFDGFLSSYGQLYYLPELTDYLTEGNTYMFIDNETSHEPVILQSPEFKPVSEVTDSFIPFAHGAPLSERDIGTYHVNTAALKRIGVWLKKLQDDKVYDNTRIIIIADHGRDVYTPVFADFSDNTFVYADYNPLMLMKDFDARNPLHEDMTFMTNADAAILAVKGLAIPTINPFTGNDIISEEVKAKVPVYRGPWAAKPSMGTTFEYELEYSFEVEKNIFVESNWKRMKQ